MITTLKLPSARLVVHTMTSNKRLKLTIPTLADICKHQVVHHVLAEKWVQLPPGLLEPLLGQRATMDALQMRIVQDPSQVQAVMALYVQCARLADAYHFVRRPVMLAGDHARFHQMHAVVAASMGSFQVTDGMCRIRSTWTQDYAWSMNCKRFISAATRLRAARGYMWTLAELRANVLASHAAVFLNEPRIIVNATDWGSRGWAECVGQRGVWTEFEHLSGRLSWADAYPDPEVVREMTDLHQVVERLASLQATTVFVFYNPPDSAPPDSDSDDDGDGSDD